jgi:serine phosphatase RsbU (regulator of sigma subunit)
MAIQRGASISTKMIFTSIVLILFIIGLLGATSIYYSRRSFDDAALRLSEAYNSALDTRAETQTLTIVESARTALMQTDYTSLQNFVPQAAKIDRDIVAIYVITDNGMVAAHSDPKLKEKPVADVDARLGPEMAQIDKPVTKELLAEDKGGAKERRKLFARPVMGSGKKFGTLVVIYSMASLDRQLEEIEAKKRTDSQSYGVQIGLLGLVFLLAAAGISVFQALRITRPIKELAIRADQIAGGDLTTRVEIHSPDEIGVLAENFNYMADRLQVLLDETAAKAVLEKELELARTIQETLVPPADLIERGTLRIAGHFQPATQCGGDWWAVHDITPDRILVIIGDVTGHGVPAAMITAAAKAACDVGRALEGERLTPGRLLSLMNRAIFESAKRRFVMTCFACFIDMRARTITYANAGHNFPYLYRAPNALREGESEFTVLMSRGNRLGDIPDSTFNESTQNLRQGDRLVFYTDGLIECESPTGEEFGEKRLRNAIRNAGDQNPSQMRDSLMAAAGQFYSDRPRKDDITLVVAHLQ